MIGKTGRPSNINIKFHLYHLNRLMGRVTTFRIVAFFHGDGGTRSCVFRVQSERKAPFRLEQSFWQLPEVSDRKKAPRSVWRVKYTPEDWQPDKTDSLRRDEEQSAGSMESNDRLVNNSQTLVLYPNNSNGKFTLAVSEDFLWMYEN